MAYLNLDLAIGTGWALAPAVPVELDDLERQTVMVSRRDDPRSLRPHGLIDKQAALRFIVHLVGDLHQPLHAGNGADRGGNDRRVTFFGRSTNLHSVWDSGLIDETQLSFSEMAAWLNARTTRAEVKAWSETDPRVWIAESTALRDRIYPPVGDNSLSYRYVYDNEPRLEQRLEQGGVRLAAYLNTLFNGGRVVR